MWLRHQLSSNNLHTQRVESVVRVNLIKPYVHGELASYLDANPCASPVEISGKPAFTNCPPGFW